MRHAFLMKANLVFEEGLLGRMMKDYDDDNTGVIDYRKFCENVMGSHPDDAGGWGEPGSREPSPNHSPLGSPNVRDRGESPLRLLLACRWDVLLGL